MGYERNYQREYKIESLNLVERKGLIVILLVER